MTTLDLRTKLQRIQAVLPALEYESDPDTNNGFVAEVPGKDRATALQAVHAFEAAGFDASWSQDDSGRYFVWIV